MKIQVTPNVFTDGTACVNASFSSFLKKHLRWSYSTAFYPGESPFATRFAERIEAVTGLPQSHGGKFQITSYPTAISMSFKYHSLTMTVATLIKEIKLLLSEDIDSKMLDFCYC